MSLSSLTLVAAESGEHGEAAVHPVVVGLLVLAILLGLLVALVAFGGGREHS